MDAMIRDLNTLVSYRNTTLIPYEIAAVDGVIEGAVRNFYTSCHREVWWTARDVAQAGWWDRQTFERLEAFRRGNGMTPSWWRLLRKLSDNKDLRRVAELCVLGDIDRRWRNWWLDDRHPVVSAVNLLAFPVSIPVALIWRALRLRTRSRKMVEAFRDRQKGSRTPRDRMPDRVDNVYGYWSWSNIANHRTIEFREAELLGPSAPSTPARRPTDAVPDTAVVPAPSASSRWIHSAGRWWLDLTIPSPVRKVREVRLDELEEEVVTEWLRRNTSDTGQ
ncbi:hypothetical protein [Streptomyces melanogenes]|uniref:hypothetical protein n=1 Tax=Streptomyces melanogenes TaxID=67326 RepID=UPI0037894327